MDLCLKTLLRLFWFMKACYNFLNNCLTKLNKFHDVFMFSQSWYLARVIVSKPQLNRRSKAKEKMLKI